MNCADLVDPTWAYGRQQLPSLAFADILRIDAVLTTQDRLEVQWEMEAWNAALGSAENLA
jgi:hypothetical protein